MLITLAICASIAALGGFSWWALVKRRMHIGNWIGCVAVFLWLAGSGIKVYHDRSNDGDGIAQILESSAGLSWQSDSARAPAARSTASIGTVESLIGGLETKLSANPSDAGGWALLAQSYSFVGDVDGAERAIEHAVALGVLEQDLRDRVAQARRDATPRAAQRPSGG